MEVQRVTYVIRRDKASKFFDIRRVNKSTIKELAFCPVFGSRLKAARQRLGLAQDKLGVLIGLDEHTASARISRYENGIHEPPVKTAKLIAEVLGVPLAYLFCDDDRLADLILKASQLNQEQWGFLQNLLQSMTVQSAENKEN